MNKNSFIKHLLFVLAVVFFASCDNDFNVLGTDIVGIDNFELEKMEYPVRTTNIELGAVETTNLPVNPLGVYNNPVYGLTHANFATQLQLATINPTFNLDLVPDIQSVVMTIPYFSKTLTTATTNGTTTTPGTYSLDSIYGPKPREPFSLRVYESGYFIRDVNPADQLTQSYFSDQDPDFNAVKGQWLNDDTATPAENDQFVFSDTENVEIYKKSDSTTSVTRNAALRVNLNKAYFNTKIFHAPAGKLVNNNVFKDYFRGLYFKVEQNAGSRGNLGMINFKGGKIVITYKEFDTAPTAANPNPHRSTKRIVLNLAGNTVSLINQAPRNVAPDPKKLFIKGGGGHSMAVIDLFNSQAQLDELRNSNLLINDATLTFTIDKEAMDMGAPDKAYEPLRLYLYDLNNRKTLADYSLDYTTSTKSPKLNKLLYSGIIQEDDNDRGIQYKIRITKHVFQMIRLDSTNVRLGLVVTEDINNVANTRVKTPQLAGKLKTVPIMSAIHPLGTILFGSDIPVGDADYVNRPKFEIYFTKPKQN